MNHRTSFLNAHFERIDQCRPSQRTKKHQKMAASPFVFFRGSSQLFYADIANQTLTLPDRNWPLTTIMGDCHTSNFGFFTEEGSHGDRVVFSANDFDDACFGDPVWDILRFLVSLELSIEHCKMVSTGKIHGDNKYLGLPSVNAHGIREAEKNFVSAYIATCSEVIADKKRVNKAIIDFGGSEVFNRRFKKAKKRAAGGSQFDSKSALAKAVVKQGSTLKFDVASPKFNELSNPVYDDLYLQFLPYMNDEILDIVERVDSGTGSVDLARYYFLVGPIRDCSTEAMNLSHIVELKQQRVAAPLYYFPDISPKNMLNPAHLTFRCQRQMQLSPDVLLDEVKWRDKHWLVRSRHHAKVGFDPEHIGLGEDNVKNGFSHYAEACGSELALAHCRGDRRSNEYAHAMVDGLALMSNHLIDIAKLYSQQVIKDWDWMKREILDTNQS